MANPNFNKILDMSTTDQEATDLSRENWKKLASKEHLTPMEMMQEAAFTELINKESLERL